MKNFRVSSTIYVSQSHGSDWNNGLAPVSTPDGEGPVETVGRALEFIAQMRAAGMRRPMTVAFTEDTYLTSPILVDRKPSYQMNTDGLYLGGVTFTSYGGRKKVVGGIRLTGWKKDVFNSVPCYSVRLTPGADGAYPVFTDLYVNGRRADLTRYPSDGSSLTAVDT